MCIVVFPATAIYKSATILLEGTIICFYEKISAKKIGEEVFQ